MDEFTEEEFLTQKQRIEHHYRKATTQDSPSAYLIVGQPGAGKTRMANIFSEAHNGNIAFINGDEYRKYHPTTANLSTHTAMMPSFIQQSSRAG